MAMSDIERDLRDTLSGVDVRPAPNLRARVDRRVSVQRRRFAAAVIGAGLAAAAIVTGISGAVATNDPTTKVDAGPAGSATTTEPLATTAAPTTTAPSETTIVTVALPPPTTTTAPPTCATADLSITLSEGSGAAG